MTPMSQEDVERMLRTSRIGRLAMADAGGRPYVIPLPFTWANGALYLRLPMTGRKGEVLQQNRKVCFEIDHYTDTLDDYASVLVEGHLAEVPDIAEKQRIREITRSKYERLRQGYRPGHGRQTPIEQMPLCKIVVEQISGRQRERPAE